MIMSFFEKNKKILVILASIVAGIVVLMLITQLIIGNILENKIENILSKKDNKNYTIKIGKIKVNLFTMTLILKELDISPDSILLEEVKSVKSSKKSAYKLSIPVVRIRNFRLFNFLINREIGINEFLINDADIYIYKDASSSAAKPKTNNNPTKKIKLDSIVIPGINGVSINKILLSKFSFSMINLKSNDTTFSAKNLDLNYKNIALVQNDSNDKSLRLVVADIEIKMLNEQFNLPGGKYSLSFDNLSLNIEKKMLVFTDLKIKPRYSLTKMANMSKYQYEIYTCEINRVEVHSILPLKILQTSNIILSEIVVDSMNLSIYKDKHFPFDTTKRPKIPTQSLKLLKNELYVGSIIVKNSKVTYSELHQKMDVPMEVNLSNVNASVSNITSISDSIAHNSIMSIKLLANLQNAIPMGVNIYFPLNSVADTFSFNGWLGSGNMKLFNKILLPAIGIKFDAGYIDGLKFSAKANSTYSIGNMTMLYHDLDGVVVRKDRSGTG